MSVSSSSPQPQPSPYPERKLSSELASFIMKAVRQFGQRLFSTAPSPPRSVKTAGFVLLDASTKIEEERMPAYERNLYYPVQLGDVYHSQYQVLSKLGFGANSTVWFCRDLRAHRYVALKIYIYSAKPNREVEVLRHLSTVGQSSHHGRSVIRTMLDNFEIDGSRGKHQCIIHEPLLASLLHFQATFNPPRLNEDLVRGILQQLLLALDFLHTKAQVTHTDIQAKNIIIGSSDPSVFREWDREEESQPSARKVIGDQVIYQSRPFRRSGNLRRFGLPILSDFGEARIGSRHQGSVQPNLYRAPEVSLGMEWTSKVDIWNVGVLMWDLLEGRHLFDARGSDGQYSTAQHLAEMVALLGPPPLEFLQISSESSKYWTKEGQWKNLVDIPQASLENSLVCLEGQSKTAFLKFALKMLQWDPEKRLSARELLEDSWLDLKL